MGCLDRFRWVSGGGGRVFSTVTPNKTSSRASGSYSFFRTAGIHSTRKTKWNANSLDDSLSFLSARLFQFREDRLFWLIGFSNKAV